MVDADHMLYALNNIHWHLWVQPDYRLIECLLLQILTLLSLMMCVSSISTIIGSIKKHRHVLCHWSIRFSIGILLLSSLLSAASFILLIYQQNGRHFDFADFECKVVVILLVLFAILAPTTTLISIMSYSRWQSLLFDLEQNKTFKMNELQWYSTKPLDDGAKIDLVHLIAVNHKDEQNEIVLNAHKSRYKLHLLSFLGQLVLMMAMQYKNYNEEQEKLIKWGHRFSRVLRTDDYYIAKWELEHGIVDHREQHQDFESLDWLEYVARSSL